MNINVEIEPSLRAGALAVLHKRSFRTLAFSPRYGLDLTSLELG